MNDTRIDGFLDGRLRLILAHGIGRAFVADDVAPTAIAATLAAAR